uniref:Uncharacterized protein n=1 Tax=Candidatus Kentrum sp. FW TaxID=2126338 RepID=A0A450TE45_9GAMM|nr:MAG: hypothetical protein BECKFW1821B_GA0114236_11022 [Candidatus Kentron sp. FW]
MANRPSAVCWFAPMISTYWKTSSTATPPPRQTAEISDDLWRKIERLKEEQAGISANPQLLARLLCSITSPRLSRAKMTGHDSLWQPLARVPFAEVLWWVARGTDEDREGPE